MQGSGGRSTGERERILLRQVALVLAEVDLVRLDEPILDRAARLDPPALRSLDAIHLATALSLDDLEAIVTYDDQMADAARSAGLTVSVPGRS